MLYSPKGAIYLQEKGKEKEGLFSNITFPGSNLGGVNHSTFPICSKNYVFFELEAEESPKNSKLYSTLLVTLPMNSSRKKQRSLNRNYENEYFVPFDDNYVMARMFMSSKSNEVKVYRLNGDLVQTVNFPTGYSSKQT